MSPGRRAGGLAAAAVTAVSVGACGGHAASRSDVVHRANAICADTLSRVRAVPPPTGTSATALDRYLKRVRPIVDAQARSIAALPRPAERRATLDAFVTQVRAAAHSFDDAQTAAARGDAGGASGALAGLRSNRASSLAQRYGLTQCTGTVATLGR